MAGSEAGVARKSKIGYHSFTEEDVDSIRKQLLTWYDANKRDLPWRRHVSITDDPDIRAYSVWVSEIMLQQTQVATVVAYYKKWMKKWPTVVDLSKATHEEVKEMWAGLGYYRRATRLWEGACLVAKELEGKVPLNAKDLMKKLPGVGRYTAGAIASIAHGERTGVLDGNVVRVLSRVRAVGAVVGKAAVDEHLWSLANGLVDPKRPGDFNQALMELGALVCAPKSPGCSCCPLNRHCLARELVASSGVGRSVAEPSTEPVEPHCIEDCHLCLPKKEPWIQSLGVCNFPRKAAKKKPSQEKYFVAIVSRGLEVLIVQRPDKGLLAGMWEFVLIPYPEKKEDEDDPDIDFSLLRKELTRRGIVTKSARDLIHLGQLTHLFSHTHHTYSAYSVTIDAEEGDALALDDRPFLWVPSGELCSCALSTAMKKLYGLRSQQAGRKRKHGNIGQSVDKGKQKKLDSFFTAKS
nr:A/G-specific adenine glycosylase [Halisarca dujardinii]